MPTIQSVKWLDTVWLGLVVTALRTSTQLPYMSTGMGDRVRDQFPVRYIYLSMWPGNPGQLSLAIPT